MLCNRNIQMYRAEKVIMFVSEFVRFPPQIKLTVLIYSLSPFIMKF